MKSHKCQRIDCEKRITKKDHWYCVKHESTKYHQDISRVFGTLNSDRKRASTYISIEG